MLGLDPNRKKHMVVKMPSFVCYSKFQCLKMCCVFIALIFVLLQFPLRKIGWILVFIVKERFGYLGSRSDLQIKLLFFVYIKAHTVRIKETMVKYYCADLLNSEQS